jgi:ubiquinone/menaquinone biosynthesis C-methylase UbiE
MLKLIRGVLEIPLLFDLQQRLCNNYSNVAVEFSEYLSGPALDVLDVGCSTGTCGAAVIDMKQHRYTGVDLVRGYVERAAKRYPAGRYCEIDAQEMAFEDESFDLALYVGVLHHMDDQTARNCLKETWRVLRRHGRVLIAEPVFTTGHALSTLFLRLDRGGFIRNEDGYRVLFRPFRVTRERNFQLSLHRFCSFVLEK